MQADSKTHTCAPEEHGNISQTSLEKFQVHSIVTCLYFTPFFLKEIEVCSAFLNSQTGGSHLLKTSKPKQPPKELH